MALRDEMCDAGRAGGTQRAQDVAFTMDFGVRTLQQEADAGGWTPGTYPAGAKVPRSLDTSGTPDRDAL